MTIAYPTRQLTVPGPPPPRGIRREIGDLRVFWQGPTIGVDLGADGARTMMLVYNLPRTDAIYQQFNGIAGGAVGGLRRQVGTSHFEHAFNESPSESDATIETKNRTRRSLLARTFVRTLSTYGVRGAGGPGSGTGAGGGPGHFLLALCARRSQTTVRQGRYIRLL